MTATELLDAMGLYTMEVYQKSREETNLLDVTTKATLAAAFRVALDKLGFTFSREAQKS